MNHRHLLCVAALLASALVVGAGSALAGPAAPGADRGPIVGEAASYAESPRIGELGPAAGSEGSPSPRVNPLAGEPGAGRRGTAARAGVPADPLAAAGTAPGRTPGLDLSFRGTGNPQACGSCSPPDTIGDVGPNHYIQMVNATKVAIFDKAGTALEPPFDLGELWPLADPCSGNGGDPVILYDGIAGRWLLSQFQSPDVLCFAISQTGDPLGDYHLYSFHVGEFPDYFKVGVWRNAYYVSANESTYTAYAFDRAKMLTGDPTALFVKFTGEENFLLPADVDGPTPPRRNAGGLFYTFKDNSFHGVSDRIELFRLRPDFAVPADSTFRRIKTFQIEPFTYTVCGFFVLNCVRQRGTTQRIDTVSEWPMHRFPYRRFGGHETLLGNFTVGGGSGERGAAIRWFELRNPGSGWSLFQEGTHDPGDGNDRFMGSIAMDQNHNIALGYTVSSSDVFPSIRYATRTPGNPPGTLQAERTLQTGGGSQTGSNRWGDYSAMSVDPSTDCQFWYTNEFYPVSATTTWKTKIGAFTMPSCP